LGVVEVIDDEAKLLLDSFVPQQGFNDKLEYFAENGHDHLAAAVQNLASERPTTLEQSVSANALSPASVDELSMMARSLWKLVMQQVVERAVELEAKDKKSMAHGAVSRMNFGVYFYSDNPAETHGSGDNKLPVENPVNKLPTKRNNGVTTSPRKKKLRSKTS
jgi:hypothetical protein